MIQQEQCLLGKENFESTRYESIEFGNASAEEIVLTQFTNGNSHFHRSRHI